MPKNSRKMPVQRLTISPETTASDEEAEYVRALVYNETLEAFSKRVCMCKQTVGLLCSQVPIRPNTMAMARDMIAEERRRSPAADGHAKCPDDEYHATAEESSQMRAMIIDEMLDPLSKRIGICKQTIASFCARFPMRSGTIHQLRQLLADESSEKACAM